MSALLLRRRHQAGIDITGLSESLLPSPVIIAIDVCPYFVMHSAGSADLCVGPPKLFGLLVGTVDRRYRRARMKPSRL